jgi:general secretion pathway protein D
VQSGETVALGGLMQDQIDNSHFGVPVLSSLPLVGNLFGTNSQRMSRSELLILITPRMIGAPYGAQSVTDELRLKLDSLAPDVGAALTPARPGSPMVPNPLPPRTPQIDMWAPGRNPNLPPNDGNR